MKSRQRPNFWLAQRMQIIEAMVGGFGNRRFTSMAVVVWLAAVLLPATPGDGDARCRTAGHHQQCADMPSLTCCCGSDTAVATEVVACLVAKASLLPVQPSPAVHTEVDGITANCDAHARVCAALFPSTAGPPLDRPLLYSTLRL